MPLTTKLLIAAASFAVLAAIIALVRRKRLDEKYALLWLGAGIIMLVAPLATPVIDKLSHILGFYYPPAFVFLIALFALCLINLQYSVVISRLTKYNRSLAQKYAVMEDRIKQLERQQSS